ncbi:MAG: YcaQ family DNA glycosylase [Spirochaetes bacterium]|nr:YcaQ family DNA glycosylase [Spirochaetota bacterium]
MGDVEITREQLVSFLIYYQQFYSESAESPHKLVLEYIRKTGCIQFDPLDVTGRNADLVLQSRIPGYREEILADLLYRKRKLIDGWDKMMSIYPMEDWPYFERKRSDSLYHLKNSERGKPVYEVAAEVIKFIKKNGPVCSSDMDLGASTDWYWAPTSRFRAALEGLFHAGELIIHNKVKNRKYYDLSSNVIPREIIKRKIFKNEADYHDWYVLRRFGNWGIFWNNSGDGWLGAVKGTELNASVKRLVAADKLRKIGVKNNLNSFFIRADDYSLFEKYMQSDNHTEFAKNPLLKFIAPLDNFIWDRKFIEEIFGFFYRWEVYKPQNERNFGYYVLPVLFGNSFIARFEPRRDKKTKTLFIKNWWWEEGWSQKKISKKIIEKSLNRFCAFLGCTSVSFDISLPENGILKI